jgi:lipopolysaccharide transport system ATP-binding protein
MVSCAFKAQRSSRTRHPGVDEVLAVGDRQFQQKCLGKMDEVSRREGRTLLFVSHNLGIIEKLCATTIWLKEGSIYRSGRTETVIEAYLSSEIPKHDRIVELRKLPRPYVRGERFHLITFEWLANCH